MKMSRKWENGSVNIGINIIQTKMACWSGTTGGNNKLQKVERAQFTFSDHNGINLILIIKLQQRTPGI